MSPLSTALPSRPERTHTKATGFENVSDEGLKSSKNKSWQRAINYNFPESPESAEDDSFNHLPRPPESPEDDSFIHLPKKAERKDRASCVFLLWGSGNSESFTTWAVDVLISDPNNEEEIFTLLAKQYATELGFLRRHLSFRKFSKLRPVTFRFISRSSRRFSVFAQPLDLISLRKIYSERQEKATTIIESIEDFDSGGFPNHCYRDSSREYNHCNSDCPTHFPTDGLSAPVCPFEEWAICNDQLRWIETAPFLSCYFRNPAGARSQDVLNGFDNHCFIYEYRKVSLPLNQLQRHNRFVKLNGLYVETAWDSIKCICVFLGTLLCVVTGGRFFWGSWEITFGAGSFTIALPMLALTVLSYYEA